MQGDFNFTLGSRWQSKGAGVAVVTQLDPGTTLPVAMSYKDGREIWLYADGREHGPGVLTSRYDITGPADGHTPATQPQAPGMRGEDLAADIADRIADTVFGSAWDVDRKRELKQLLIEFADALLAARRLRVEKWGE